MYHPVPPAAATVATAAAEPAPSEAATTSVEDSSAPKSADVEDAKDMETDQGEREAKIYESVWYIGIKIGTLGALSTSADTLDSTQMQSIELRSSDQVLNLKAWRSQRSNLPKP